MAREGFRRTITTTTTDTVEKIPPAQEAPNGPTREEVDANLDKLHKASAGAVLVGGIVGFAVGGPLGALIGAGMGAAPWAIADELVQKQRSEEDRGE